MTQGAQLLLVDDHPLFLDGLSHLLGSQEWVATVTTANTIAEAMQRCGTAAFDVAVVDLRLPDGDGVDLTRRLLARQPSLRVLVLTMHADSDAVLRAMASGAAGYVLKDAEPDEVRDAVRQVARGSLVIGAGAATSLQNTFTRSPFDISVLSERDKELLKLLASGLATGVIAARLHVSPKTVRNRLSELYARINVSTRAEAIVFARDAGLGR